MQQNRLEEAENEFTRVIAIAPGFAEGWNKRATVRFMRENFAGSIGDCQETLARNPNHFGASSGQELSATCRWASTSKRQCVSPRVGNPSSSRWRTLQLSAGGSRGRRQRVSSLTGHFNSVKKAILVVVILLCATARPVRSETSIHLNVVYPAITGVMTALWVASESKTFAKIWFGDYAVVHRIGSSGR